MNCASRLAELFESWAVPAGQMPFNVRGGDQGDGGLVTWRRVGDAVFLVSEVDRVLAGMRAQGEPLTEWEAELPQWYAAVYSRDAQWRTTAPPGGAPTLPPTSLQALRMLGRHLDRVVPESTIDQPARDALAKLFIEAFELVSATDEIPEAQRVRLLGLLDAARRVLYALDNIGTDQLRAAVDQVAIALSYARVHTTDPERQSRLQSIGTAMLRAAGYAGATFSGAVIGALGSDVGEGAAQVIRHL